MIGVVLAIVALLAAAFFLDELGRPRTALVSLGFAAVLVAAFVVVLGMQGEQSRVPVPEPLAPYGPTCVEVRWLDEKWTCVPVDQAG